MSNWLAIDNIEKVAMIAAVIIGGLWVYYNFFKGRTYKPRLEPIVSGKIFDQDGKLYLITTAKLKNAGLSKVEIEQEGTALRVFSYIREQPTFTDLVEVEWLATFPVFLDHKWVEPGKGIDDELLIALPYNSIFAIRTELQVIASGIECKTIAIVTKTSEKEKQTPG